VYTAIQKWGNSQAVRLPKIILEKAGLNENDQVELIVEDGKVIIVPAKKHLTLKERAAGYSGDYKPLEWDTGRPVGKEIW
jgi:antitoxin MazE